MGATNIQATRVWGEVKTPIGGVQFGRMPVHWGSGLVFNAGNNPLDEFGDTADRIQFTAKADQVFVMTALESNNERFVNARDDAWSAAAAVMYNTERASTGLYTNYHRQSVDDLKFGLFTLDLYGGAEAGALKIDLELAANFGSETFPTALMGYESAHLVPPWMRPSIPQNCSLAWAPALRPVTKTPPTRPFIPFALIPITTLA